jgi:hypothetical protein
MPSYYLVLPVTIIVVIIIYLLYNNKESLENIYKAPSCGIVNNNNNCHTCDDFVEAHRKAGLIYDKDQFAQCHD